MCQIILKYSRILKQKLKKWNSKHTYLHRKGGEKYA